MGVCDFSGSTKLSHLRGPADTAPTSLLLVTIIWPPSGLCLAIPSHSQGFALWERGHFQRFGEKSTKTDQNARQLHSAAVGASSSHDTQVKHQVIHLPALLAHWSALLDKRGGRPHIKVTPLPPKLKGPATTRTCQNLRARGPTPNRPTPADRHLNNN